MQTKPLLYGLMGFFIGGLLVSVAATTFDKPKEETTNNSSMNSMSMSDMSAMLVGKTGDEYDKAFIEGMMAHHKGAVAMARQSADNAKHDEIKRLSEDIIAAQEQEISQMKQWQTMWGYNNSNTTDNMSH